VVHRELERLLVIVTLQGAPIAVFAKRRLERVGRQNEVRDVRRRVATLHRNMLFRIICRDPSCAVPFRDDRSLPVHTHQTDSTQILLRVPLETPKDRFVIRGGRLRSPIQMSFASSIRSQNQSSRHFRDLQFLDVLVGFVFNDFIVRPFTVLVDRQSLSLLWELAMLRHC